ncbi:MAG TPA: PA2169 family four-helix-bundle protein [Flavipsychrobacter sp.]|nr:PA2169 family four-helix-bundle protein [Flavipsychrobacter sp.]
MQNKEMASDVLNDLVKINNDRVEGYQRAINESKDLDVDMKGMFEEMIKQSEQYKKELSGRIRQLGGNVEAGTTSSGKIYRAWMDVKATFAGSDKKAILASCEFGEDAAQRAYEAALSSEAETDQATKDLINTQQQALKDSHDIIKKFRDAHEAVG